MNGRVLVVCASRNNPERIRRMIESVSATSTKADVAAYFDEDDLSDWPALELTFSGPRIGPCRAANLVVGKCPGYSVYGWAVDDCEFVTSGWDDWALKFQDKAQAICPQTNKGVPRRMDFPFLSGHWVKAHGSFVPYEVEHFYWDIALQIVGEQVGIQFARPDQFTIEHEGVMPLPEEPNNGQISDYGRRVLNSHTDARTTCRWLALERAGMVNNLQKYNRSLSEAS